MLNSIVLLPTGAWRFICSYVMLVVITLACSMLFTPKLAKAIKKTDSVLHDSVFKYGFFDYEGPTALFFAFSKKGDNVELNELKTITKLYQLTKMLMLIDVILILF
ncbi:MAG: hypothetical protein FWE97_00505 [Dehalococcoidia bacterium]|nr:hypothetical protein [Dehalococcoidia bacterium]